MNAKLEGVHCSYHCPNYHGGSVVSLCNKYGENLNYSKKGKPLALGVCFADELQAQLKATQDELEFRKAQIEVEREEAAELTSQRDIAVEALLNISQVACELSPEQKLSNEALATIQQSKGEV